MRWPSLFTGVDSSAEEWIVAQMHIVTIVYPFYFHFFKIDQLKKGLSVMYVCICD